MYLDWDVQLDGLAAHAGLRVGHAVVAHGDRSPRDAHGGAAGALRHELEAHAEVVGGAQSASLLKTQEQASEQASGTRSTIISPEVVVHVRLLLLGRDAHLVGREALIEAPCRDVALHLELPQRHL